MIRACRTVAGAAFSVLVGFPPLRFIVRERYEIFRYIDREAPPPGAKEEGLEESKRELMALIELMAWNIEWSEDDTEKWTYRWILDLRSWIKRKHGDLSFHFTQMLTDHSVFAMYLKRIGSVRSDLCWFGCKIPNDPEHTL